MSAAITVEANRQQSRKRRISRLYQAASQCARPWQASESPFSASGGGAERAPLPTLVKAMLMLALRGARIPLRENVSAFPDVRQCATRTLHRLVRLQRCDVPREPAVSHGLLVTAHYTFSKALEVNGPLLQYNFGAEGYSFPTGNYIDYSQNRRLSSNDIPHRVVATWLYQLPFGKGHKLNAGNAAMNFIASGWQVSGTWMFQSGTPVLATGASNGSLNGRPDVVAGADFILPESYQKWYDGRTRVTLPSGRVITPCNFCFLKYNPDAFTGRTVRVANGMLQRDQYWWGTAGFTFDALRNEALNNVTMSLQRQFKLIERFELSLQAHAHNLLNHTQFNPATRRAWAPRRLSMTKQPAGR